MIPTMAIFTISEWLPVDQPIQDEVLGQLQSETLLFIGLAILGLVIVAWWIRRRIRRSPAEKLKRALGQFNSVTILMHPNPDPDAMGCAIGIQRIAEWIGADAEICYSGQIRHQENRAFQTVLNLEFQKIESINEISNSGIVLVDHNEPRGFEGAEAVVPEIVIDHHTGNGTGTLFTDVRSEYGTCASIIAEYFRDLGARKYGPDDEVPEGDRSLQLTSEIATGLMYGIQSDTNRLTMGCHDADFEAASYLFDTIDPDWLDRIANPPVTAEVLRTKANAITNIDIDGSFAVSFVGELGDADAIPQAADELLQLEGITAVVVMGQRNGTIHLSGRSRDDRVHMGRALEAATDHIPMASAGGHARMGGGRIDLEYMEGIGPSGGTSEEDLKERLFNCMNGDI